MIEFALFKLSENGTTAVDRRTAPADFDFDTLAAEYADHLPLGMIMQNPEIHGCFVPTIIRGGNQGIKVMSPCRGLDAAFSLMVAAMREAAKVSGVERP